jgi:hypothetical protein
MLSDDVVFQVDLKGLVMDAKDLQALTHFLRSKKFLSRDYKGTGKGFAGSEYDYKLVGCDEGARFEIKPVPENIWLYLNTFGKDEK